MLKKAYVLWLLGLVLLSPLAQAAKPTVQFDSATYVVNEDVGTVTITVTISEAPNNTVTVDYSTSDGSATEGEDYTGESGTLLWDLFDGSDKTIFVAINEDSEEEGDETFKLTLSNASKAKLGEPKQADVTIQDNDGPPLFGTFQFSSFEYEVQEGKDFANAIVSRVNGSNNVVSVQCVSINGTAKAGKDYTSVSRTLQWSHGETGDKVCNVAINDDEEVEDDEFFSLHLKNATGGADIGDPSSAAVTIIDNDTEYPAGIFKFSEPEYSVNEDEKFVTLKVSRAYGNYGAVSVDYASSDETAEAGKDYVGIYNTLSWRDGDDSEKTITIFITDDSSDEDDYETFIMALSNPTGGTRLGIPNSVVVTIIDDDSTVPNGTLQFSESKYIVYEDGKTIAVPVTRTKGSEGTISVECATSDGTATVGDDYIRVFGELNWGNGDTSDKSCIVSILDDTFYEGNETFNLSLKNTTGGARIGKQKKAVVTIIDNDDSRGTLQFSSATYSVDEDGGSVKITVIRIHGSDGKASVKVVTSNGTAKKNKDFKKISKKLTWKDGKDGERTFTVDIVDDNKAEGDETFKLKLKKAKGAELSTPKAAEVTIVDDD
jgi:ribosomal protein L35AE/L33A